MELMSWLSFVWTINILLFIHLIISIFESPHQKQLLETLGSFFVVILILIIGLLIV